MLFVEKISLCNITIIIVMTACLLRSNQDNNGWNETLKFKAKDQTHANSCENAHDCFYRKMEDKSWNAKACNMMCTTPLQRESKRKAEGTRPWRFCSVLSQDAEYCLDGWFILSVNSAQFKTCCNGHRCRSCNAWKRGTCVLAGSLDHRKPGWLSACSQCPGPPVLDVCERLLWLPVFLMTYVGELLLCLHCPSQLQEEAVRYRRQQQTKHCIRSWNRWPAKNM